MIKRLLIIDDDQEMCEELAEILKDQGYDVHVAFNGLKGRELIEKYYYDVLLLDLKISGLSGFDILKDLKEKNIKLKVLVLTGRPLTKTLAEERNCKDEVKEEEEKILEMADGVINKPFNIERVLLRIGELVEKSRKKEELMEGRNEKK